MVGPPVGRWGNAPRFALRARVYLCAVVNHVYRWKDGGPTGRQMGECASVLHNQTRRDERKMPCETGQNAMFPQNLRYMESHEWARQEEDVATVGITDYAQAEIQDIVYVELPEVGTHVTQKTEFGVIESVKAAFDLYAPVSGEVIAVNETLVDAPEHVNTSPYEDGWLIKIRMDAPVELEALLDAETYQKQI